MTDKPRCRLCGDTKRLNDNGVCEWRHGCEHRQFQHEETMKRLTRELEIQEARQRHPTAVGNILWNIYRPHLRDLMFPPPLLFGYPEGEQEQLFDWEDPDDDLDY